MTRRARGQDQRFHEYALKAGTIVAQQLLDAVTDADHTHRNAGVGVVYTYYVVPVRGDSDDEQVGEPSNEATVFQAVA